VFTLRAIERDLVSDSFVSCYRIGDHFSDGLVGDESTFNMCSFWYVECLSRLGDLQQARFVFEKMVTHLAFISAAYDLDRRLSAAGHTA
jgi:GH15 family glucan-1,4-alpha-glucosidase